MGIVTRIGTRVTASVFFRCVLFESNKIGEKVKSGPFGDLSELRMFKKKTSYDGAATDTVHHQFSHPSQIF